MSSRTTATSHLAFDESVPGPARRITEYLARIIMVATSPDVRADAGVQTSLKCRRRPGRRPCPGVLIVHCLPDQILYSCTSCSENGTITRWQGCEWDQSVTHPPPQPTLRAQVPAGKFEVCLSDEELRVLAKFDAPIADVAAIVRSARRIADEDGVVVTASLHNLEDLAGALAFEVNHARRWTHRIEMLNEIAEAIEGALTTASRGPK